MTCRRYDGKGFTHDNRQQRNLCHCRDCYVCVERRKSSQTRTGPKLTAVGAGDAGCWFRHRYVGGLLVRAKTAEPIEMPFEGQTRLGLKKHRLDWGRH